MQLVLWSGTLLWRTNNVQSHMTWAIAKECWMTQFVLSLWCACKMLRCVHKCMHKTKLKSSDRMISIPLQCHNYRSTLWTMLQNEIWEIYMSRVLHIIEFQNKGSKWCHTLCAECNLENRFLTIIVMHIDWKENMVRYVLYVQFTRFKVTKDLFSNRSRVVKASPMWCNSVPDTV